MIVSWKNVKDYQNVKNSLNVKSILMMILMIYFPTITATIRCVLKQGDLFYPQVYLDDALYQNLLFKMISYEKIEDKFDYQPNVCNDCHDFSMTVIDLSDFFYY